MTESAPRDPTPAAEHADREDASWRLEDIANELATVGLAADLRDASGVPDLTFSAAGSGRQPIAILDPDGYCELRFWISLSATPAEAANAIGRVLATVTAPQLTTASAALVRRT